jgi:hypothetical protein
LRLSAEQVALLDERARFRRSTQGGCGNSRRRATRAAWGRRRRRRKSAPGPRARSEVGGRWGARGSRCVGESDEAGCSASAEREACAPALRGRRGNPYPDFPPGMDSPYLDLTRTRCCSDCRRAPTET